MYSHVTKGTTGRFVGRPLNRLLGAFIAAIAVTISGCSTTPNSTAAQTRTCTDNGPEIACTEQGAIRGVAEGDILAFKGIPFAKPPVGQLRWRAPEAPVAWQGVRDGSRFGAVCPQIAGKDVIGDEDCLSLNIWRPKTLPAKPLPVMVFFIGGGNHAFSGQGSPGFGGVSYNGGKLVPEGVVYVSFNFRLGALGFLAHPSLDAERAEKVSGNYGSLDQIALLRWLKQNIAAFGGDPNRIFLFGTSAGGANICALMTSPMARGLFHGASMQSGVPTGCKLQTRAETQQGTGNRVAQTLGCGTQANSAACMRSKSTNDIVQALPGTFGVLPRLYGPNVDGHVFPDQPIAVISRRGHAAMPVIIGDSTDETMLFVNAVGPITDGASYHAAIEKVFGTAAAPRIRAAYPAESHRSPREAFVRVTTDALFTCQSRRVAGTLASAQKEPVYRYLFAHTLENDPQQKALGAVHTIEHMFFFPWQGTYRPAAADLKVQEGMIKYWTNMAKSGRPDVEGKRSWPAYTPQNDGYLEIAAENSIKSGPQNAKCDFWDTVTLPWPHL